ncbi:MAG: ABC transporter ATP-binding protein [Planctomycetota bacterium]|nr:ABC transporter ATP-binding protein [Planctomycetota bacterium]
MSYVYVRKLWVNYGPLSAVKGISFTVPRGEVFGFIGPNGAGKSSTIKVLATLLKPSAGTVLIDGLNVATRPQEVRRRIGFMPDSFGVYEDLTAGQYLHFFAAAYHIERRRRPAVVDGVLEITDLRGKADAPVDSLSRGMKQRLSLARVLLHDPQLILLDEPASGLDPRARIELRELLKELSRMGKTILISSHILHELSQLCTRVGIIEAGRMVAEGSLQEIYRTMDLRRVVHVQVANPSEQLLRGILGIPGVLEVENEVDRIRIELREGTVPVEALLDRIHGLGARIRLFQPEAMDMETAFMKLTRGEIA